MPRQNNGSPYHNPQSVEELTRSNVEAIAALESVALSQRSPMDCFVDGVTHFCGRIVFVYLHVALFATWIGWNTLAPRHLRFARIRSSSSPSRFRWKRFSCQRLF